MCSQCVCEKRVKEHRIKGLMCDGWFTFIMTLTEPFNTTYQESPFSPWWNTGDMCEW